ncbi:family 1 encapsulin nanocompartment shell protein [Salinisphaera sp.]|uniref:family 1 encapsulin nanocompartment shell protein n=1 Tax=Salinisphaera sp. TaxID=1914330 RepID=UPI002D794D9B|nr:family 1 encapsulin nanocompartment shell protein [Salinisphaera sp.]HET7315135.1 family 1 encapsulin nanocompartment shell protein [Salinisphaera sp.]
MNHLHRELAPITPAGWAEIEEEASQTLRRMLAGRKLFDFEGPHGWEHAAANLGRVQSLSDAPVDGARVRRRIVQPLIEARIPFEIERDELEAAARGAADIDLDAVAEAARQAAMLEDHALFNGYDAAGIAGVMTASEHEPLPIESDYTRYPGLVAEASERLRSAGVDGPYAIALGPRCYTELTRTTEQGYPVMEHVRRLIDGPIVWAPAVDGAVVMSMRGGDFIMHVGQDFSIGYTEHNETHVRLYIQESFTALVFGPEAAVPLRHT